MGAEAWLGWGLFGMGVVICGGNLLSLIKYAWSGKKSSMPPFVGGGLLLAGGWAVLGDLTGYWYFLVFFDVTFAIWIYLIVAMPVRVLLRNRKSAKKRN